MTGYQVIGSTETRTVQPHLNNRIDGWRLAASGLTITAETRSLGSSSTANVYVMISTLQARVAELEQEKTEILAALAEATSWISSPTEANVNAFTRAVFEIPGLDLYLSGNTFIVIAFNEEAEDAFFDLSPVNFDLDYFLFPIEDDSWEWQVAHATKLNP
jgi:hypothetical protein